MKWHDAIVKFTGTITIEDPQFILPDKATLPQVRNANVCNQVVHSEYRKDLLTKTGCFLVIIGGIAYLIPKVTNSIKDIINHKNKLEKED